MVACVQYIDICRKKKLFSVDAIHDWSRNLRLSHNRREGDNVDFLKKKRPRDNVGSVTISWHTFLSVLHALSALIICALDTC